MTGQASAIPAHTFGPVDWVGEAQAIATRSERAVLVFVAKHYGSTPREKGCWMLVRPDVSLGTLGGGEVERVIEAAARDMLAERQPWQRIYEKYMLGPDMGQCCGGGMEVVFEPIDESSADWLTAAQHCIVENRPGFVVITCDSPEQHPHVNAVALPQNLDEAKGIHIQPLIDKRPSLVVYGAGHVARALAGIAAHLPIRLTVVDSRQKELDLLPKSKNITSVLMQDPPAHAAALHADGVLIMTHSHSLDYRLCLKLLKKKDLSYVGLIGSKSKGARFRRRFEKDDGLTGEEIARLTSPIGQGGVSGKEPGLIALSALNEVMTILGGAVAQQTRQQKVKS